MNTEKSVAADLVDQRTGRRKPNDNAGVQYLVYHENAGCGAKAQNIEAVEAIAWWPDECGE
jgi:hypothetical protein